MHSRSAAPWVRSPWFLTSPPQPTPGLIARQRLTSRVASTLESTNIVVVAAPSGYGKTVLLGMLAQQRSGVSAWLTLTRHGDDEELILLGILSALACLPGGPEFDAQFDSPPVARRPAEVRDLYGRIAAAVHAHSEPVFIMLDEAQHAGPRLCKIVDLLTDLTDSRLRFIVAGKPELLTWFAKRIAANPLITFTSADLTMSVADIVEDAENHGEILDITDAQARFQATGGWPVALHLHRLGHATTGTGAPQRASLIADVIERNVLPTLSPALREFVLDATTCSRVDPALAKALSGHADAAALLEECVTAGLFLDRLGDASAHPVYRWHEVFAEACRDIVARVDMRRRHELEAIAAGVLSSRFPTEALAHAVNAEDPALTLRIIRSTWIRVIVESGAGVLLKSCLSLPPSLAENPEVLIVRACCLNLRGDRSDARMLTAMANARGADDPHYATTRPFADLFLRDDQAGLTRAADEAQSLLENGESEPTMHAFRVFLVGWTRVRLRDVGEAARLLLTAADEARLSRRPILQKRAASNLLFALAYTGRFSEADRLLADVLMTEDAADDWGHYDGGIGLFAVGYSAFWRGRFREASGAFQSLANDGGHEESYAALGRMLLAFIAAHESRPPGIAEARTQLRRIGRSETHGVPWPAYRTSARAALLAAEAQTDRAIELITTLRNEAKVPIVRIIAAEIARRAGKLTLAMELLAGLSAEVRSVSYVTAAAQTTAALVADERGDATRAHRHLEQALDAAVSEGVLQPFLMPEARLQNLLSEHAVAGTQHAEFVAARLAAFEQSSPGSVGKPLSARERENLGYLRTSMTASEIAAALFVSVNTVRTHQRAIYLKLGVTNRRDAVRQRP